IRAVAPDRAVVVGVDGTVATCTTTCKLHDAGTSFELKGVWGDAKQLIAVGRHGSVVRGAKDSWKSEMLPGTPYLRAVWGSDPKNVLAVGSPGSPLVRFDGERFVEQPGPSKRTYRAISGTGPNSIWLG